MLIDDKLNWKLHINYLSNLLSMNVGMINKLKCLLPIRILYSTLILPYLNYGVVAWGAAAKIHLDIFFAHSKESNKDYFGGKCAFAY